VSKRAIAVPGGQLWLQVADDLEHGYGPTDSYLLRTAEQGGKGALITLDEHMKALPTVRCLMH